MSRTATQQRTRTDLIHPSGRGDVPRRDAGADATGEVEMHEAEEANTIQRPTTAAFCQRCGYVLHSTGMVRCPVCQCRQCVNCGG